MKASLHHPAGELSEAVFGIAFMSNLDDPPWPPGCPPLNRFPGMVFCGVTMFTEGRVAVLPDGDGPWRPMPDWVVFGPRTRPVTSATLEPIRCATAIFYPDAFALLTGVAPGELQDRDEPAGAWLPPAWDEWPAALRERAGDEAAQRAWIEQWLAARWQEVRPRWNRSLGHGLRQIARRGLAATVRALGVGERQAQRQFRSSVGLTPVQARRLVRMNEAVYALRDGGGDSTTLAELAAELGYADQAHMARELRALTGLPPSRLEERIESDSEFWPYRL